MKESLKQTVTDMKWDKYVRTLSNVEKKLVRTLAKEVKRLILGDDLEFW
jgi:hypothetical protein